MERRHCEYYDQPHHHYTAYVTADANQPTVMQRTNQQKRSSFETYLSSLLSFYRSKPRIHRLRMRRRHDRILSRASHNHKASKDSATRASRRLQSTEQQQQQFELSTGHEWHAADELPLENEEVYYDEQHSDFGYNDNQAPSVAGSYQQQQQQPKRKRGRPRKQNSDKQQQPQDGGLNHFLDDEEQELCTSLNLSLEEYLKAKQKFREAFETQGPFRKTASRRLVPHLEIPVISKLYDHFVRINLIVKV
jgi:hypothetical protein